jgi:hypothetical protein
VTIPGLLLAATIVLAAAWNARRRWLRPAAGVLAVAVVVWPYATWGSLFTVREQGGRLDEARTVCRALDGRPAVLVAPAPPYLATVRSLCDVEVVTADDGSPASLAAIRRTWGTDVDIVTFGASSVTWAGGTAPAPTRTTVVSAWEQKLLFRPSHDAPVLSQVWVGEIGADGTVTPAGPAGGPTLSQG